MKMSPFSAPFSGAPKSEGFIRPVRVPRCARGEVQSRQEAVAAVRRERPQRAVEHDVRRVQEGAAVGKKPPRRRVISLRYSSATGTEGSKHGGRTVISGFFVALSRNALRPY